MSRDAARRPLDDRGSSLVELTVALLVFGLFAGGLATAVLQTTRFTRDSTVRETTGQELSTAMKQVSKDLRTAVRVGPPSDSPVAFAPVAPGPPATAGATATQVAFYSSVEPSVLRERLYVTGGALFKETKIPDDGTTYPHLRYDSPDATRTTTRRLTPPGLVTTATFSYVLRGTAGFVNDVAPADLGRITGVKVVITADRDGPGRVRPTELENTVHPFNL